MPKRSRLTNNSDETEIAALISGDNVFSIPYFQRAYKWKAERLEQLHRDVLKIVDDPTDFHFLGAIIVHGRRSNPSDPDVYDVIDGQQRITTIFLYLCAIVKTLAEKGETQEAVGIFLKYLVIGRDTDLPSNVKMHPCKDDRAQLNYVINDILSNAALKERLGAVKVKALPSSGNSKGTLTNNYRTIIRFLKEQSEQEGIERIRAIYKALLESMSVVQIDVWDPTNGPKIFDSLNSRQEPMTIGDLVRNEIFSRVAAEHPDNIEYIDHHHWQPFYKKFKEGDKNLFDAYFFPYGLTQDPNLKKSEVYNRLRKSWESINDPQTIIEKLATYQNAFIDIVRGTNYQEHPPSISSLFINLREANIPTTTYPFLMQLSNAIRETKVSEACAIDMLQVVESFLVRRAICGHEPTGLHAVFKRLWADCEAEPGAERVSQSIRAHRTVYWPNDEDVIRAVTERPCGDNIRKFLVLEYDKSLQADHPSQIWWLEHVLPTNPSPQWFDAFTREQHERMVNLLANFIPLSQEMNQQLSNAAYEIKRAKYQEDSMFVSARRFADTFERWTPDTLEERGRALAKWALSRWQY